MNLPQKPPTLRAQEKQVHYVSMSPASCLIGNCGASGNCSHPMYLHGGHIMATHSSPQYLPNSSEGVSLGYLPEMARRLLLGQHGST